MAKPFDATLKQLITRHPADWLRHLGLPADDAVEILSPDLSAVTAAADTLLRVGQRVVHIDIESGPDARLARRMLLYNVLAHYHTGLPVHSVAVLLRPNARRANLAPAVRYAPKPAAGRMDFRFEIVRVWETPADVLLAGGVGLSPLAVLGRPPAGRTRKEHLPTVVSRIADLADRESADDAGKMLMSAYILTGMRLNHTETRVLFQRVLAMRESSTYVAILEEGATEHAHKTLLALGAVRFGEPSPEVTNRVKAIQNLDRLDRLLVRLLAVESWDALLRGR